MVLNLIDSAWGELTGRNESRRAAEKQRDFAREQFDEERKLQRSIGQEAQNKYQQAMKQFGASTSGTPESVSRLQQLIRDRSLPEQQRAMSQGRITRQQQGVRGIDASVLEQQQANALQRQLAQDAENVALQQQLKDREMKQKLAADQATASFVKSFQRNI